MKSAKLISKIDQNKLGPVRLDDFSRFKEKMIMINTLKKLVDETDKDIYKTVAQKEGDKMTHKSLKRALEEIVDIAIKRVDK